MTARELIDMLAKVDPNQQVLIFDADANRDMPVSGMVYGGLGPTILYSDSDEEEDAA